MKTLADYPVFIRWRAAIEIGLDFGYSEHKLATDLLPRLQKYYPPGRSAHATRALYKTSEVFDLLQPRPFPAGK